ncbi:oligopeptide ABC transporter substrate-binding protein [Spiroplasma helicoides]|uniref:Oligopeptide ABC transporter substrate-binding protein n=1 Tax=Spiroplasma helicoides TaxID=216938 RepID=A0A1B3SKJ4_9MOLU|nr:ABC transporter substrate-binding protein [Spiroplasma helicoides]AOG60461.1 oligopeptide ABC transporter substrate-binding protein [Spiroplasma helicoides]
MSNKLKKLLSLKIGFAATLVVSSFSISCGFSIDKILNREWNSKTYVATYQYAVTSWNTAYTFQATNYNILANTNANPLGVDEYGRTFGDIFESGKKDSTYVGEHNEDFTEWTYQIRDEAKWSSWDGTNVFSITTDDFDTTAEFVMRSSITNSEITNLWNTFIKGAEGLNKYLIDNENASWSDAKNNNHDFGLILDKSSKTVKFKLRKSVPYFESLLCFGAFAPIHLDSRKNMANITNFKEAYYSGAFLPKEIKNQDEMILEKSQSYWFKDMVSIDKIKYLYIISKPTPSTERELFEAGNSSGFVINNKDDQGWNRYIGSDINKPTFDHTYDTPTIDSVASSALYFNLYNSTIDDSDNIEKQRAIKASKLLQNKYARAWISTKIDRSVFLKYYTDKFDNNQPTSQMIRNTYTAAKVGVDKNNKDYTKYIEDEVKNIVGTEKANEVDLSAGVDAYKDKTQLYTDKTDQQILSDLKKYMVQEKIINSENEKFNLQVLLNPEDIATLNPRAINMYDRFNEIDGNPIQIKVKENVTTADEYLSLWTQGKFDLCNGNWWPDYADPATFLNTLTINGDASTRTGTAKLFQYNTKDNHYYVKDFLKTSISDDFARKYEKYNNEIIKADQTQVDLKNRYTEFAKQEASYLYKDFLALPFYIKAAPKSYYIGYVIPYTASYAFTYGVSGLKDFSKVLSNKLVSYEESETQRQRVEDYKKLILNDKNMKKEDSEDRNYILFK